MAKNKLKPVDIHELRYPVYISRRLQVPNPTTGIIEWLVETVYIHAKIEPLYATTFYSAQETDRPITHMIWIRHLDWLGTTHVVLRDRILRSGVIQQDTYRIRRIKETAGRQRFMELEVEMEQRQPV